MKAFEKWYNNHETKTIASDRYHAHVAWRAALEWAKKYQVTVESLPYNDGETDTESVIPVYILDEELADDSPVSS